MPASHPNTAATALLLWFVANDGTFEPLSDAEPVLLPRVNPPERVAAGGFDYYFTPAVAIIDARMLAALLALLPVVDRSRSAVDLIISRGPDPMLANLLNGGPGGLHGWLTWHGSPNWRCSTRATSTWRFPISTCSVWRWSLVRRTVQRQ